MVMPVCSKVEPPLIPTGRRGHYVACHLYPGASLPEYGLISSRSPEVIEIPSTAPPLEGGPLSSPTPADLPAPSTPTAAEGRPTPVDPVVLQRLVTGWRDAPVEPTDPAGGPGPNSPRSLAVPPEPAP